MLSWTLETSPHVPPLAWPESCPFMGLCWGFCRAPGTRLNLPVWSLNNWPLTSVFDIKQQEKGRSPALQVRICCCVGRALSPPCPTCSPFCPQHIAWHAGLTCQEAPAGSQNSPAAALKYRWCWCSKVCGWCLPMASVCECWVWGDDSFPAKPSTLGLQVHSAE